MTVRNNSQDPVAAYLNASVNQVFDALLMMAENNSNLNSPDSPGQGPEDNSSGDNKPVGGQDPSDSEIADLIYDLIHAGDTAPPDAQHDTMVAPEVNASASKDPITDDSRDTCIPCWLARLYHQIFG